MYHVMFSCSGCKAFLAYSIKNQLIVISLLYLAMSLTYLETRSAFFPFVEVFLQALYNL